MTKGGYFIGLESPLAAELRMLRMRLMIAVQSVLCKQQRIALSLRHHNACQYRKCIFEMEWPGTEKCIRRFIVAK